LLEYGHGRNVQQARKLLCSQSTAKTSDAALKAQAVLYVCIECFSFHACNLAWVLKIARQAYWQELYSSQDAMLQSFSGSKTIENFS
jgi:hypothetical protein